MSQDSTTTVVPNISAPVEGSVPDVHAEVSNTPEAPVTPEPKDFLAPKFAALTRKEKLVRQQEAQIKAREAAIAAKEAELESKSKSTQSTEAGLLAEMKANPLKFMSKHGLTFEQLMQMQMNDENPTPEMQLQAVEAKLRAEMEEKYGKLTETLKEKEEREATAKYEAAVSTYKQELTQFVSQNADTYELIVANGATELMFETAEAFYQETGKVPDNEELAKAVEAHLEEQANQIFKLKKFQKLQPTPQNQEAKPKETAPTLSNTLASEVPKQGSKLLSDEQSLAEAAKMLRWNK